MDNVYLSEPKIKEKLNENYNNCMNHLLKDKNTMRYINPTYGLWSKDVLYSTTNELSKPSSYTDPYLNREHHFKKNQFKEFEEALLMAKALIKPLNSKEEKKK